MGFDQLRTVKSFGEQEVKIRREDLQKIADVFRHVIINYSKMIPSWRSGDKEDRYIHGFSHGVNMAEDMFRELYLAACNDRSVDLEQFVKKIPAFDDGVV